MIENAKYGKAAWVATGCGGMTATSPCRPARDLGLGARRGAPMPWPTRGPRPAAPKGTVPSPDRSQLRERERTRGGSSGRIAARTATRRAGAGVVTSSFYPVGVLHAHECA